MRKTAFLLVLVFLFNACQLLVAPDDSNGNSDELAQINGLPEGHFEVQVQGYITRSIQGEAVFETLHGLANEPYFWLRLRDLKDEDGTRQHRIIDFLANQEEPLKRGVYTLPIIEQGKERVAGNVSVAYQDSEVKGSVFKSTGGTLEIYASNTGHVEGAFHFTAYDDVKASPGLFERAEIVVSGKFYAVAGEVGVILN